MSTSDRTKRRRIIQEVNVLRGVYLNSEFNSDYHPITLEREPLLEQNIEEQVEPIFIPQINIDDIEESEVLLFPFIQSHNDSHIDECSITSILPRQSTQFTSLDDLNNNDDIQQFLATWAAHYNVPHNTVNG